MNNEMKLLRAFIKASGYEIKEVGGGVSPARRKELEDNDMLFTLAAEDVIDYKVTKKNGVDYVSILKKVIDAGDPQHELGLDLYNEIMEIINEKD